MASGELRPLRADLGDLRIEKEEEFRPRKNRRWIWLFVAIFLFAAAGVAFLFYSKDVLSVPEVRVGEAILVTPDEARTVLTSSGYVVSRQRSTIGANVSGRLDRLFVDEGSAVKKGDLIAELDSRDYAAKLQEAEANFADAARELERQKRLLAGGAGTQQAIDAQQTRLEVFRAQVEIARVNLANTRIVAPFDGVVLQKMSELGEMVSPGVVSGAVSSGAIVLLGSDEIEIEADVNESNFSRIFPGQEAEIVIDALPGRKFRGRVRLVEPKADRQKAVVQARVTILESDPSFRPEMGAKVSFLSGESKSQAREAYVQIPPEALTERDGEKGVFQFVEGRAEFRAVRFLSGGERVILAPPPSLRSGARVRLSK